MHQNQVSKAMQDCIRVCLDCSDICRQTLAHCLSLGGKHAEQDHVRHLLDCAEICQTSANFMSRGSDRHVDTCGVCADVCRECAESCRAIGGGEMDHCSETCERCATSCEQMASDGGARDDKAEMRRATTGSRRRSTESQPFA